MAPYYSFSIAIGGIEPSIVYGPRCTQILLREYWLMRELGYAESCVLPHPMTTGAYFPGFVSKNHPRHDKQWTPDPKFQYRIVLESAVALVRFDVCKIEAELSALSVEYPLNSQSHSYAEFVADENDRWTLSKTCKFAEL